MTIACNIYFENGPSKCYYSGQKIRGNVHLTLHERKKIRGVYVSLKGDANTKWSEQVQQYVGSGADRKSVTVTKWYYGHENCVHWKVFLVGGTAGEMHLDPGQYNYPFEFTLPNSLPSTFDGTYGDINYRIKVSVVNPWWFDSNFEEPIYITKFYDLNDHQWLHAAVNVEKEFTYYPCLIFCCCPSDPMKITARLPVGGFCPGQIIGVTLLADNESDRPIPRFTIELKKSITYYAEGKIQIEKFTVVQSQSSRGVETNQKREIGPINLQVPSSLPPSDDTNCGIIKIRYYIRIQAESGRLCSNPKLKVPIEIGTHPIRHVEERMAAFNGPPDFTPLAPVITFQPSAHPSALPPTLPSLPSGLPQALPPPLPSTLPSAPPVEMKGNHEEEQSASAPPYPNDDPPDYEKCQNTSNPVNSENRKSNND